MKEYIRRALAAFGVAVVFAMCLLQTNFVEAKAQITWVTTDVILEAGKCTVKGYFKNNGDRGGSVTNVKFIVDVQTKNKAHSIWSGLWEDVPKDCYVRAGEQRNWDFWYKDSAIPSYSGEKYWNVNRTIWTR